MKSYSKNFFKNIQFRKLEWTIFRQELKFKLKKLNKINIIREFSKIMKGKNKGKKSSYKSVNMIYGGRKIRLPAYSNREGQVKVGVIGRRRVYQRG